MYFSKMTANFSRARYSKWPPPPSQKKTRNKRLLSHNELKRQKGVIFHQVWHYKSTGTIIVDFLTILASKSKMATVRHIEKTRNLTTQYQQRATELTACLGQFAHSADQVS